MTSSIFSCLKDRELGHRKPLVRSLTREWAGRVFSNCQTKNYTLQQIAFEERLLFFDLIKNTAVTLHVDPSNNYFVRVWHDAPSFQEEAFSVSLDPVDKVKVFKIINDRAVILAQLKDEDNAHYNRFTEIDLKTHTVATSLFPTEFMKLDLVHNPENNTYFLSRYKGTSNRFEFTYFTSQDQESFEFKHDRYSGLSYDSDCSQTFMSQDFLVLLGQSAIYYKPREESTFHEIPHPKHPGVQKTQIISACLSSHTLVLAKWISHRVEVTPKYMVEVYNLDEPHTPPTWTLANPLQEIFVRSDLLFVPEASLTEVYTLPGLIPMVTLNWGGTPSFFSFNEYPESQTNYELVLFHRTQIEVSLIDKRTERVESCSIENDLNLRVHRSQCKKWHEGCLFFVCEGHLLSLNLTSLFPLKET